MPPASEWPIADVLSHLGSGRRPSVTGCRATINGGEASGAQVVDALVSDAELLSLVDAMSTEDRTRFAATMGPMTLDLVFPGF